MVAMEKCLVHLRLLVRILKILKKVLHSCKKGQNLEFDYD